MKYNSDNNNTGGIAAREQSGPLWYFLTANDGSFLAPNADYISKLYFPLMNNHGMKCSVTPELKGDILSSFQNYLSAATVTEELHRNISGRNFWIKIQGKPPWSAAGNSAFQKAEKWTGNGDKSEVEGQIGAFTVRRKNTKLGLESEICIFVPDTDDHVELMKVTITNISKKDLTLTPISATPIFGRHADNFRDHRQVTTMCQKIYTEDHGVRVKPTIVHNELGHSINKTSYAVLGYEGNGDKPSQIWPLMYDFIGEGGSLDNPEAVSRDLCAPSYAQSEADGNEAIGAMRYSDKTLAAGEKAEYIILHGITEDDNDLERWKEKFGSTVKFDEHLDETLSYWQKISNSISCKTSNTSFDNWTKWVTFQIKCRQIFGNSFLPDFGYGRGGRGWRDLWQDLLSLFLVDPDGAKQEIINCLRGVRIDGSNATIIGSEPGVFIADRNNVTRSWCDHGAWPAFVLNFYIEQTGDLDILFQEVPYWKDQFTCRSRQKDEEYHKSQGTWQTNISGENYEASILEHILIQQFSAFYNVGDHNILLLEGGDWNDTYDMAREKGESTGFYAFYGQNLKLLANWLKALSEKGVEHISLLKEILTLVNTDGRSHTYSNVHKKKQLNHYFSQVSHNVSGEKVKVGIQTLILDLMMKADHITEVIRDQEWIQMSGDKGFFNGHYDNNGNPVDGAKGDRVMMDLTTQVMTTMHDLATKDQIRALMKSADCYLKDEKGYRLCTPFPDIDLDVGRISGYIYGNKEHGSKWMQQNIMLAYGLYRQGFREQATDIIRDAFKLSTDSAVAKIFPGLPSYFGPEDQGAYAYLTGSSTWFLLTLTTQMFGVRGEMGNLCLQPKLMPSFFDESGKTSIECTFRGIRLKVTYFLSDELEVNSYSLDGIEINGHKPNILEKDETKYIININDLLKISKQDVNQIKITLKRKT